jgi:hypothetical protein
MDIKDALDKFPSPDTIVTTTTHLPSIKANICGRLNAFEDQFDKHTKEVGDEVKGVKEQLEALTGKVEALDARQQAALQANNALERKVKELDVIVRQLVTVVNAGQRALGGSPSKPQTKITGPSTTLPPQYNASAMSMPPWPTVPATSATRGTSVPSALGMTEPPTGGSSASDRRGYRRRRSTLFGEPNSDERPSKRMAGAVHGSVTGKDNNDSPSDKTFKKGPAKPPANWSFDL